MSTLDTATTLHLAAALAALVIGPVALWARRGGQSRPRLHRAAGYAWVTFMVVAAVSALFIRHSPLALLAGFSPIHLLVPVTLGLLVLAFRHLLQGRVAAHRKPMLGLYFGACLGAGVFTLLPGRFLGQLVWGQWLGVV